MLSFDGLLTQVFEAVEEEQVEDGEEEANPSLPDVSNIPEELESWRDDQATHKDSPSLQMQEVHRFPWSPKSSAMRHGPGTVSAPQLRHPGLPPIQPRPRRQPDWKPVRKKQVPRQSHLNPVMIPEVETGDHWSPPKVRGGGAWGGILQAQHRRLAGVLAKQHKEVSNLQNQLAALQQLNRMGVLVGQNAQTDGTVHEYMAKIAPKFGRRGPQWQPSSHPSTSPSFVSQEFSEEIFEKVDIFEKADIEESFEMPEAQREDSQSCQGSEQLEPSSPKEHDEPMPDMTEAIPADEDQQEVPGEAGEDVVVIRQEAPVELLSLEPQEESEGVTGDPEAKANPADLQATGLPDMSKWAEYRAPDEMCELAEEPASQVSSFFHGQAQASLRDAAETFAHDEYSYIPEEATEALDAAPGELRILAAEGLSASWMKEFEAAAAGSQPGRATAEVLIDNLNLQQLDNLSISRRTSGMCLICRDGQGDFLGQIGATKDPDELRQEAERYQEGKEVKEDLEPEDAEKLSAEDSPDEHEEIHEAEQDSDEAEIGKKPEAKEVLIRGKDWTALTAECDALLESCKRSALEDESGEFPFELQGEDIEATMVSLSHFEEFKKEADMDLDL